MIDDYKTIMTKEDFLSRTSKINVIKNSLYTIFKSKLPEDTVGHVYTSDDKLPLEEYVQNGNPVLVWTTTDYSEAKDIYERYIWDITRMILQGNFSMLVMDEVIGACNAGLVNEDELMEMLEQFPDDMEIVLTGRNPSNQLCDWADYLTEMKKIKHPFDQGVKARKGIEY